MEAPAKRRGRAGRIAAGIAVIVIAGLWLLVCAAVAFTASALGGEEVSGWVLTSVVTVAGFLLLVLGVSLVRGRRPSRSGWVLVGAVSAVILALPVGAVDRGGADDAVNRAVELAYMERGGGDDVAADCDVVFEHSDGEFWECILESPTVYEICEVDIRRAKTVTALIRDCV